MNEEYAVLTDKECQEYGTGEQCVAPCNLHLSKSNHVQLSLRQLNRLKLRRDLYTLITPKIRKLPRRYHSEKVDSLSSVYSEALLFG